MKLFMIGKLKYNYFELPEKIEDSLLIPYKIENQSIDNLITIKAANGSWI